MSDLTRVRRSVNASDEGFGGADTRSHSSTRRYQTQPQPTSSKRRPANVPDRASASRLAPRTAPVKYDVVGVNTQDDPDYRRRQRSRTTDSYDPRLVQQQARSQARSYVDDDPDELEEPYPHPNRRQRRRKLSPREALLVKVLCTLVIAALFLYFLGSIAFSAFVMNISDPANFGPEHGNVVELVDNGQRYYIQGIDDHGQTEMIEVPEEHPEQAKIYLGPLDTDHDANVDLQIKDLNHDEHPDIIEHVEPKSFLWLFVPRPSVDFDYLNDGKGQFKLQSQEQEVSNGK